MPDGIVQLFLRLEHHAEVVVRFGVGRLDRQRLAVQPHRFVQPSVGLPHDAEIVVHLGEAGPQLDSLCEVAGRFGTVARPPPRYRGCSARAPDPPIAGADARRLAKMPLRVVDLPRREVCEAERRVERAPLRVRHEHRQITCHVAARGFAPVVLLQQRKIALGLWHDLHPGIGHLIGGLPAVHDAPGGTVRVPSVAGGVVVGIPHSDRRSLRKGDGNGVAILSLPVKIPILYPDERLRRAVGQVAETRTSLPR